MPYDSLSDVFSTLRLTGEIFFRADIAGTFAVAVPPQTKQIRFHLVRYGECEVAVDDGPAVRLGEGDLAIVPNGAGQVLSDGSGRPAVPLADLLAACPIGADGVLRVGESGRPVGLLCGYCRFDEAVEHPVLARLPAMLVLRSRELGAAPWLATSLRLIREEAELGGQGMAGILGRLLEAVFIQAVRRMVAEAPDGGTGPGGYLAALADRRLSRAIHAIHAAPERDWTVAQLADLAGMSRAAFARRFAEAVDDSPMGYLTAWRLAKARRLLKETDLATEEIAERCGYASLPSFTRRFKAAFGLGPGSFRRLA